MATPETLAGIAADAAEHARDEMLQSARLLHRRLGKLLDTGDEQLGYDFPTILSLLVRLRDSIESYRSARAISGALAQAAADGGQDGSEEVTRLRAFVQRIIELNVPEGDEAAALNGIRWAAPRYRLAVSDC